MSPTLIYIHGQYGSPEEAEHYRPLFPGCERVRGNDHFAFRYSNDWLKSNGGIILSGDLMHA